MEKLIGESLKGYELLDRVGSGGFGAVYRAYQSTLGREVAVKIILPGYANHPDFIRRFEAEAQLVARLEHLHIVPLYDYWREPGGAYLVMRWLRGGSARDALKEGPFDLKLAVLLLDQVASALATAHAQDIVHRDLKPSNILLDEEGNAYLADFGIAKDLRQENGELPTGADIVGSPDYLSPEQARRQPVTPQSDIYSLGVTLYELLTGAHPFAGSAGVERLFKHIDEPLPPITTLEGGVQEGVNAVIGKATAKNPGRRYADALALAAAFREAVRLDGEAPADELVEALTLREQEILHYIVEGHSNREIAEELYIEHSTVKWHIRQLYAKLGVRSRRQAMVKGRELELLVPGEAAEADEGRAATSVSVALPRPLNPYKGLRAFATADSKHFFGREALVKKVAGRLQPVPSSGRAEAAGAGRFLAIVGPSGSGKSSLVKAGLIPALRAGAVPGAKRWFVVEMAPGARPLDELEVALIRVAAEQAPNVRQQLERDENGLLRTAELILPRGSEDGGNDLLLVIDHFEELFTLVADEGERAHFLRLLAAAAGDGRSRVRVVVTLRADYYDRPLHYPEFGELLRRQMETVLPLSAEELERAIVQPALQAGVRFEDGLVAAIIDDTLYQPGALPLLQYALTELFEQREGRLLTRAAYDAFGGATGALSRRAEELYLEQDAAGREAIRQLFLRLVAGEEVRRAEDAGDVVAAPHIRRRVPRAELTGVAADEEQMEELIDAYTRYRLLTLDHDPQTRRPTVEVAHEALLREWGRLGAWLEESREDVYQQRRLQALAQEWVKSGREPGMLLRQTRLDQFAGWAAETDLALTGDERAFLEASGAARQARQAEEVARQAHEARLERRARRVLQALAAVFLVAAAVSGWFALTANRNFAHAESQRLAAEATNVLQRGGSPELATLLALRGLDAHYTPQADLALQRAAAVFVDSKVIEAPGGAFWPALSPDNHYLRFARNDPEGAGPPIVEVWDLQTMERLWQTSEYVIPGSPFENRDATADNPALVAVPFDDSALLLLDVETGKRLLTFPGLTSGLVTFHISPDGNVVIAGEGNGDVHVWRMDTGEEIRRFSVGDGPYAREPGRELAVGVSPDNRLAVATADGQTQVWDIESGEELHRFEHVHEGYGSPQFADGGRLLLAATLPALSLWDLETGQEVAHGIPVPGNEGLLSPDGRVFAQAFAGELEQYVVLWEVGTGRELHRLTGHSDGARPIAFANEGEQLFTWGWEGTARRWDVATGQERLVLAGHTDAMAGATLSADERLLVTTGQDNTVRIWNLDAPLRATNRLVGARRLLQYAPDSRVALTADQETASAVLVDADSFAVRHRLGFTPFTLDGSHTSSPPFSSDGEMVLGASKDGTILVYAVGSGELLAEHANPDGVYKHPAFVPGSRRILAGGERGAYLLDAENGEQVRVFDAPGSDATNPHSDLVAVSHDGRYGAMHVEADGQHVVYLWDLATGEVVFQTAPHPSDFVVAFAFSDDNRYFAWGGNGNIVYVLDIESGEVVSQLAHLDSVHSIDISADNRQLLASTGGDGVILWDLASGEVVRRFYAEAGQAGFVRFEADDSFVLYSYLGDGSIHRQPLSAEGLVGSMCARLQRDLTPVELQVYDLDAGPTCPKFAGPRY